MCNEHIFVICVALILVWYYFWVYKEGKTLCEVFGMSEKKEEPKKECPTTVVVEKPPAEEKSPIASVSLTEGYQNDTRDFNFTERNFSEMLH